MANSRVARRYARALLELGREMKVVDEITSDVKLLGTAISGSRQLKLFLASPIVNHDRKKSVVNELFRSKIGDLVYRFVILLIDKGREELIEEIVVQYQSLLDDMMGIVRADVRGAYQFDPGELANIEMRLTKVTKRKVHAAFSVDPKLIGGFIAKIGDTVYDGSLRRQLELLRLQLTESKTIKS